MKESIIYLFQVIVRIFVFQCVLLFISWFIWGLMNPMTFSVTGKIIWLILTVLNARNSLDADD